MLRKQREAKMATVRKTFDEFHVQQYYVDTHGWETVHVEPTRKAAKQSLKEYRANMPEYPTRLHVARIKKEGATRSYGELKWLGGVLGPAYWAFVYNEPYECFGQTEYRSRGAGEQWETKALAIKWLVENGWQRESVNVWARYES